VPTAYRVGKAADDVGIAVDGVGMAAARCTHKVNRCTNPRQATSPGFPAPTLHRPAAHPAYSAAARTIHLKQKKGGLPVRATRR